MAEELNSVLAKWPSRGFTVPAMALASAKVIATISPLWCVGGFPRRVRVLCLTPTFR
jgi:hypothetical protein